jgi:hypothetical protein
MDIRITTLKIRRRGLSVDVVTTSHNSLRWAAQAIDVNERLATSLGECSITKPPLLTDSIYLLIHRFEPNILPENSHVILWDGMNSYLELIENFPSVVNRPDLRFFVVGWLDGVISRSEIQVEPLYPLTISDHAMQWKKVLRRGSKFHSPYWYRTLTSVLTHVRYCKNWVSDTHKHRTLATGGKIVFCGLVTPTSHNLDAFFIGAALPGLRSMCEALTGLKYTDDVQAIDRKMRPIIEVIRESSFRDASSLACVYSLLNVMHRIATLSFLHSLGADLFVNETRSSSRFDPYDSFYYQKNLYIDFGSTRGPDAVYPRTLDLLLTRKRYISFRYLSAVQPLPQYLDNLNANDFSMVAASHARGALKAFQDMPLN